MSLRPSIPIKSGWQLGAAGGLSAGYLKCTEPKPYKPRRSYNPITGQWEVD